ncbi:kunitz-type protease inhibitor 1-like [Alosa sapidissima]|uniref:kunitz-type protease inhibitor 1-like n=1 Tax=Alosa sapidissima TaxID=34773 RepID=UPI001C08F038|nr:kunitz-type protease inhibitor 1-like [Alosa sapidissima]
MVSTRLVVIWSCFLLCLQRSLADVTDQSCTKTFEKGQDNFVLNTVDSVKEGATYIDALKVSPKECVAACCRDLNCNLALINKTGVEQDLPDCFLFDCLYKQKYVCRFVRKDGFINYILDSVYDNYLDGPTTDPGEDDKHPIADAGQDMVVQPNEIVTLNGHQSWDDDNIISYMWSQVSGDPSVKMQKTKLKDQIELSNLKPGVYKFELKVTDTSDQTDTAQVTVLVLTPEQSEGQCLAPKKVGPCRGSFPRWNYNAVTDQCEEFMFGGCKGNRNNYLSEKECTDACKGASAVASGRTITPATEVCGKMCQAEQFRCDNGCCLDKTLECDEVAQCSDGSDEADCRELNNTLTRLLDVDLNKWKARCTEPPVTGPCRASMTRWYYDPLSRKCHRFNYGGCSGNDNNFEQEDDCMDRCKSVTETDVFARGLFERHEQEETQSGSVAIAVVLGVCILAILALLGYCFLKERRKKGQHMRVATNGAQLPLTDDSEHLVYKATTKPV